MVLGLWHLCIEIACKRIGLNLPSNIVFIHEFKL